MLVFKVVDREGCQYDPTLLPIVNQALLAPFRQKGRLARDGLEATTGCSRSSKASGVLLTNKDAAETLSVSSAPSLTSSSRSFLDRLAGNIATRIGGGPFTQPQVQGSRVGKAPANKLDADVPGKG